MRPAEVIELNAPPVASESAIAKALEALFESKDVIELRALSQRGRKQTYAGYFDHKHRSELISEAVRLNQSGAAVYVTLNRIDSQLLARYANRIEPGAQATATDANVTRRRWLLLDFDPVRPKDTSATDLQLEAAKERAREAYRFLKQESWPDPVITESGNGIHLLYPIDLANDNEARDLIKGALESLAQRFDNEAVKLDTSVFNAARIVKLYGTVANKGDHTPLSPWRLSRILQAPKRNGLVTPEQLRALLPGPSPIPQHAAPLSVAARFDLNDFLARLGIGFRCDMHEGRERFKLDHCPFHPEHGRSEAAIFRAASGQLGFKCQHNSCADKTWRNVRELLDLSRVRRVTRGAKTPESLDLQRERETPTLSDPDGSGGLRLTSLAALLDEPEESQSWLVEGTLCSAGISLLAAKPKVGKSTLARNLALCVARGEPWLGFKVQRGRVIYLALEEKRAELRRQFRQMGATSEDDILILCEPAPSDALVKLRIAVNEQKPALIVVDPLGRFLRVRDFSDYALVTQAMEPLVILARESGAHLLALHHEGKMERAGGDGVLGSTALFGAVDTLLVMRRTDKFRILYSEQRYGENIEQIVIELNKETGIVSAGGTRVAWEEASMGEAILRYLQEQKHPVEERVIQENSEGRKTVKVSALRRLVHTGNVIRTGDGKRGSPYLYNAVPENSRFLVPNICREPEKPESKNSGTPCEIRVNSGSGEFEDLSNFEVPTAKSGNDNSDDPASSREYF